MGHAARLLSPSGQVFDFRRVTFFLRAQKKSNQKKTAPCGAFRLTRNPLGAFLTCLHQRGSRNAVQNLGRVSNAV